MPVIISIGKTDNLIQNRDLLLHELLQSFPGNLSFSETRRSDLSAYYWYLPADYLRLEEEKLARRLLSLREKLSPYRIDVLYLTHLLDPGLPSAFFFDMDSTIIQEEVIDELARKNNLYDQVAKVTEEAMQGGLGFEEALRKRVVHLKGLPVTSFGELYRELNPNSGVVETLKDIKQEFHGKIAILSGGFTPVLEYFAEDHGIDYFEANHLETESGVLTGGLLGRIVGKERKREALLEMRETWKIPPEQVVAVGDGANDYLMLSEAGLGVGFHAKEGLKSKILNWVDFSGMEAILFFFGPSL